MMRRREFMQLVESVIAMDFGEIVAIGARAEIPPSKTASIR